MSFFLNVYFSFSNFFFTNCYYYQLLLLHFYLQIGWGDFCMNPVLNTQTILPPGSSKSDVMTYYLTCSASTTNPFSEPLTVAFALAQVIATNLTDMKYACENDGFILAAEKFHAAIYESIRFLNNNSECTVIQNSLFSALNGSFCTNAINGYFLLWSSYSICFIFIYLTCVLTCLLLEYFELRYWAVHETSEIVSLSSDVLRTSTSLKGLGGTNDVQDRKQLQLNKQQQWRRSKYEDYDDDDDYDNNNDLELTGVSYKQ